jgi:hypothetical protein
MYIFAMGHLVRPLLKYHYEISLSQVEITFFIYKHICFYTYTILQNGMK